MVLIHYNRVNCITTCILVSSVISRWFMGGLYGSQCLYMPGLYACSVYVMVYLVQPGILVNLGLWFKGSVLVRSMSTLKYLAGQCSIIFMPSKGVSFG